MNYGGEIDVVNSKLFDNYGEAGGSLYSAWGDILVANTTFNGEDVGLGYAGIEASSGTFVMSNCSLVSDFISLFNVTNGAIVGINIGVGGIRVEDSEVTIAETYINGTDYTGITVSDDSDVVIENSYVTGCSGYEGGGLSSENSTINVTNTVFVGNEASWGGGAWVDNGTFTNCIFYGNIAGMASGALHGTGVVEHSYFLNNNYMNRVGLGGHFAVHDSVFFRDGMIACDGSSVSQSIFTARSALATGDTAFNDVVFAGAGFGCAGATELEDYTCGGFSAGEAILQNVTVANADYYGLYALDGCVADVMGSIIWDSESAEVLGTASIEYSLVQGGYTGEGNISSDPLFAGYPASTGTWSDVYWDEGLFQTELTDETASWSPGELQGLLINVDSSSISNPIAVIANNDETNIWAWGNAVSYAAAGDSYTILDLHLQPGSPAIDSGYGLGASAADVEGNPRYDDPAATNAYDCGTDTDCVEYVDMGAYERQP